VRTKAHLSTEAATSWTALMSS